MPERRRADIHLVELGLFESRARAQAAIEAGLVTADGEPVRKPSDTVLVTASIQAEAPHPWVSRGGVKLAAALDRFGIDPAGRVCLDVGASTGGFTDVLLARGAARIYAVDVGQGQLHPRLARDPRVVRLEQTDIRRLGRDGVPDEVDLCVVDVSFISLRLVLPELPRFLRKRAYLIALVKPQFEVGRSSLGRGGIVRDEAARRAALADVSGHASDQGVAVLGTMPSPIVGGDGNREFLLMARHG
ncbi:TlyA family RNA methyltransferase [Enterovirga sp. DB1703]|uniref:TlyA family RNA methyltransferase n=1 Tax=Enterovirga aerilata TaxID=2730920 RepID=A0A849IFW6_9HYPH|nr:TlyA family RNA methyltransferase [Enterovirga sp. DB1703]